MFSIFVRRSATQNLVVCENSDDRLSGPPFVVVEDSAQPFTALNCGIHVDHTVWHLDQPIAESLVISLEVIMLRVFLHSMT